MAVSPVSRHIPSQASRERLDVDQLWDPARLLGLPRLGASIDEVLLDLCEQAHRALGEAGIWFTHESPHGERRLGVSSRELPTAMVSILEFLEPSRLSRALPGTGHADLGTVPETHGLPDLVSAALDAGFESWSWTSWKTPRHGQATLMAFHRGAWTVELGLELMMRMVSLGSQLVEEVRHPLQERSWWEAYRALFQALNEPALLIDALSGAILEANSAACSLYGYRHTEMLRLSLLELSASPHTTHQALKQALQQTRHRLHRRRDGSPFSVEINASAFVDGERPMALLLVRDTTRQTMTEAALRESEARYKGLFESAPVSIWEEDFSGVKAFLDGLGQDQVVDLEAHFQTHPEHLQACLDLIRVRNVNLRTLELYGVGDKQAFFTHLGCLFDEGSRATFIKELASFHRGERTFEAEITTRTIQGERREVFLVARLAPGAETTWSQLLVSIVDITERKRSLEELQVREAQALALVQENAVLLARFRQEAETTAMLLQEVNHRVKNNLTSILGMLDLERQAMARHGGNATAFDDLKDRIYALASVHEMLSAASWAPLNLEILCEEILRNTLAGSPVGRNVKVDLSPTKESIAVAPAVATALGMILTELATNSLKYAFAKRGSGRILVRIRTVKDAWNRVSLSYQDDGPGYPDEVLEGQRDNVGLKLIRLNARNLLRSELSFDNQRGARLTLVFQPRPMTTVPAVETP